MTCQSPDADLFGKTAKERGLVPITPLPCMLIEDDEQHRYYVTTTGVVDLATGIHQTTVPKVAYQIGALNQFCGIVAPADWQ